MNENNVPADDWRPFGLTVEAALNRGDDPAMLFDENSPIRDELRRLLSAPVAQPPATGEAECIGTQLAKHFFAERWDEAALRKGTDQAVTPEFMEWLQTMARREGVAANEAWNAGVAWARAQPPAPVQQTEAGDVCKWCCGTGRFSDHECRFCSTRWIFGATAITPPAPALPPVVMVPLTEERIMSDAANLLSQRHPDWRHFFISGVRYAERAHLIGIEASTGEQSHG